MRYQQGTRFPRLRRTEAAPPARPCPNCGTPVDDRFCPRCGQRNTERLVSFRAIVRDAVEDQLSLGGALPRTLGALLFRPGFLTREYAAGRVSRYVSPLRLYLAASVLLFVVLSFVAGFNQAWRAIQPYVPDAARQPGSVQAAPNGYVLVRLGLDTASVPGWLRPATRYYLRKEEELNRMPPREGVRVLYDATARNVPRALFLLVPLFALFLKGLYRRRLYVEHFVFVLHLHAFAFLLATAVLLVRTGWALAAGLLWLLAYLFLALHRVYPRPLPGTGLRYVALVGGYYGVLTLLTAAVMIVAVLFI